MSKIIWLPFAVEDMDDIYNFYLDKNPIVAAGIYNNILVEVNILSTHPNLGKIEPLIEHTVISFRSLIVESGRYKIIYYIYESNVYISQVWDCRQDPNNMRKNI